MRVYICPALPDWILLMVLFAVSYGAGDRGVTVRQLTWLGGILQLAYMVASLASGLLLSRRNAWPILVASTAASVLTGVACVVAVDFGPLLVAMSLLGAASGFFFNSFQCFMRGEAPAGGLARATALYTLAWSGGCSLGLLASGSFYRLGPLVLDGLTVLVGIVILGILTLHKERPHDEPSAEEHTEHGPESAAAVDRAYLWVGWIMIFTAMFAQRPLHTFHPAISAKQGVSPALASLFVCEWFMKRAESVAAMYAVCGGALIISAMAQWGVASFGRARRAANPV